MLTRKGNTLYAILLKHPGSELILADLLTPPRAARLLGGGELPLRAAGGMRMQGVLHPRYDPCPSDIAD